MDFSAFEKRIGHVFRDKSLLETAFTHRSYSMSWTPGVTTRSPDAATMWPTPEASPRRSFRGTASKRRPGVERASGLSVIHLRRFRSPRSSPIPSFLSRSTCGARALLSERNSMREPGAGPRARAPGGQGRERRRSQNRCGEDRDRRIDSGGAWKTLFSSRPRSWTAAYPLSTEFYPNTPGRR